MAIAKRIFVGLGVLCLALAGYVLCAISYDHNRGTWFPNLFDSFFYHASAVLAILGAVGLLSGIYLRRKGRELQRFDEAMKEQYPKEIE